MERFQVNILKRQEMVVPLTTVVLTRVWPDGSISVSFYSSNYRSVRPKRRKWTFSIYIG